MIEEVNAKYKRLPVELLGFSLGGGKSIAMGEEYGISTTTFNPLLGVTFTKDLKQDHNIFLKSYHENCDTTRYKSRMCMPKMI